MLHLDRNHKNMDPSIQKTHFCDQGTKIRLFRKKKMMFVSVAGSERNTKTKMNVFFKRKGKANGLRKGVPLYIRKKNMVSPMRPKSFVGPFFPWVWMSRKNVKLTRPSLGHVQVPINMPALGKGILPSSQRSAQVKLNPSGSSLEFQVVQRMFQ